LKNQFLFFCLQFYVFSFFFVIRLQFAFNHGLFLSFSARLRARKNPTRSQQMYQEICLAGNNGRTGEKQGVVLLQ